MTRSLLFNAIALCAVLIHLAHASAPPPYVPYNHPYLNPDYYNPYYRPSKPQKPEKKCLVFTPGIPTSILNVQCLCPGVQSHAIQIRPETPTLGGCMERCYESDELIQKACDDAYDLPGGGPPRYFTFNDAVLKGGQKRCCEDVCGGKFRITRPGTRFCDEIPYYPKY